MQAKSLRVQKSMAATTTTVLLVVLTCTSVLSVSANANSACPDGDQYYLGIGDNAEALEGCHQVKACNKRFGPESPQACCNGYLKRVNESQECVNERLLQQLLMNNARAALNQPDSSTVLYASFVFGAVNLLLIVVLYACIFCKTRVNQYLFQKRDTPNNSQSSQVQIHNGAALNKRQNDPDRPDDSAENIPLTGPSRIPEVTVSNQ